MSQKLKTKIYGVFYKHISENRIDIESMIVILFMAVCNSRQTLIAMDILHDRKGESLSTGKQGTRELLENSLVQDNITETVIDRTTKGLTDAEKGKYNIYVIILFQLIILSAIILI